MTSFATSDKFFQAGVCIRVRALLLELFRCQLPGCRATRWQHVLTEERFPGPLVVDLLVKELEEGEAILSIGAVGWQRPSAQTYEAVATVLMEKIHRRFPGVRVCACVSVRACVRACSWCQSRWALVTGRGALVRDCGSSLPVVCVSCLFPSPPQSSRPSREAALCVRPLVQLVVEAAAAAAAVRGEAHPRQ
jgi:hypothetical protein